MQHGFYPRKNNETVNNALLASLEMVVVNGGITLLTCDDGAYFEGVDEGFDDGLSDGCALELGMELGHSTEGSLFRTTDLLEK